MLKMLEALGRETTRVIQAAAQSRQLDIPTLCRQLEPAFAGAGFRQASPGAMKRLLVIRLDRIGDFILMGPFLRELRRNYPGAWITLVVRPVVLNLAERCPYVNEVLTLDLAEPLLTGRGLQQTLEFARESLWPRRFDGAFCPRATNSICVDGSVAYLSGARERTGFSANPFGFRDAASMRWSVVDAFFTRTAQLPQQPLQELEHNLLLLQAAGLLVRDRRLEAWFDAQDSLRAETLCEGFAPGRRLAAVGLGANEPRRIYPVEQLAQALEPLAREDGLAFLLLGGPEDQAAGQALQERLPAGMARNLAGMSTLRESEALMARTSLYIGNDTGMMHMAAALQRPIAELSCDLPVAPEMEFLRQPVRFAPWQVPYVLLHPAQGLEPCASQGAPLGCIAQEAHCITQIPPADVTAAVRQLLAIRYDSRAGNG